MRAATLGQPDQHIATVDLLFDKATQHDTGGQRCVAEHDDGATLDGATPLSVASAAVHHHFPSRHSSPVSNRYTFRK